VSRRDGGPSNRRIASLTKKPLAMTERFTRIGARIPSRPGAAAASKGKTGLTTAARDELTRLGRTWGRSGDRLALIEDLGAPFPPGSPVTLRRVRCALLSAMVAIVFPFWKMSTGSDQLQTARYESDGVAAQDSRASTNDACPA
jgi:hypothetical protein